ncbi:hypothetical protein NQ317_017339 [Molorchus minor]|uniref:C2H2-type domain-containing protein n=1 Tax=Molorchus minor TaxID=1323400 RepID=A0ABQ9J5C2_9CUCU|nr:hypothetical protein NQ317_017339 [Molorchus minor]
MCEYQTIHKGNFKHHLLRHKDNLAPDHNNVELMTCRSCVTSLVSYLRFERVCAKTEEKIQYWQDSRNSTERVKLNRVRIFCKENEHDMFGKKTLSENIVLFGIEEDHPIKTVRLKFNAIEILKSAEVEMYECETCHFRTKRKGALKRHILVHREDCEVKMYECEICNFKTKCKGSFSTHRLIHRENSEVEMYECKMCTYKTKFKHNLKAHHLIHRESSEVEMYQCETQYINGILTDIFLIHRENSKVKIYACETCQFKSKHKGSFKKHLLVHGKIFEMEMYTCEICQYKTKRKEGLKKHLLVHREDSEIEMYKCEKCQYNTKRKGDLKRHLLVHRENTEVEMYKCEKCQYKTKRKEGLKQHLVVHREDSEIEMYKCEKCQYKTNRKEGLKKHLVVHRESSEIQMKKKADCNDLMACRACAKHFVNYSTFAASCEITEERIRYWQENSNSRELMDLNHVRVFCKENNYEIAGCPRMGLAKDYNNVELMTCRSCVTSLVSYLKFEKVCAKTEEKIKYWQDNRNSTERVKLNSVRIFCEENEHEIFGKKNLV